MTSSVLSRRERKKLETRERIFQAAVSLFMEKGFENTSVDEIAEAADVAKGTFFNHFPKKESLLGYLGERRLRTVREIVERNINESLTAEEKVRVIMAALAQENLREKSLVKLIALEALKAKGALKDEGAKSIMGFIMLFRAIVDEGQRRGELHPDANPLAVAEILHGMYFSSLFKWLDFDSSYSLEEDLLEKTALIFRGLKG